MQLSCHNINVVPGKKICPRSTRMSDVMKNPEDIMSDKSIDLPAMSLSHQANIADESISIKDAQSFDNKFTQVNIILYRISLYRFGYYLMNK